VKISDLFEQYFIYPLSLFFSENVIDAVKFRIVEILFKACSRILNISKREEDTVSMLIMAVLFLYILRVFAYLRRAFN